MLNQTALIRITWTQHEQAFCFVVAFPDSLLHSCADNYYWSRQIHTDLVFIAACAGCQVRGPVHLPERQHEHHHQGLRGACTGVLQGARNLMILIRMPCCPMLSWPPRHGAIPTHASTSPALEQHALTGLTRLEQPVRPDDAQTPRPASALTPCKHHSRRLQCAAMPVVAACTL